MKKLVLAVPAFAAVASFAGESSTSFEWGTAVSSATSGIISAGEAVVAAIGGVIAIAAGLRLLVKGINRAVGK